MGERFRVLSWALGLAAVMAGTPLGFAVAAPQILGLVANAEPLPLTCAEGVCAVELSSFCLQEKRSPPRPGTAYSLARGEGLTLVVTRPDGATRHLPAAGLVRIASARAYMAVRVSLAERDLLALGALGAAIVVDREVSLVPRPEPGDPWPLTQDDVTLATGPLRAGAANFFDQEGELPVAARLVNRLINAIPSERSPGAGARDDPWRRVVGAEPAAAGDPGTRAAARIFARCRGQAESGHHATLRRCLEEQHDALMVETNSGFWEALDTGS